MEKFSLLGVEDELISRSLLRFSIKALFFILGEQIERHFGRCFLLDFDEDLPSLLAILVDIFETSSPQACWQKKGCQKRFSQVQISDTFIGPGQFYDQNTK